jgi:hypothetical protein
MRLVLTVVVTLLAFVLGFVASQALPRKKSSWEETKNNARAGHALAASNVDVLEKLEAGNIDGAKQSAANTIAFYNEFCRPWDDRSPE